MSTQGIRDPNTTHFFLFLLPSHLLPSSDRSPGEDEDDGSDVQRPPDEEGQGSSTAPNRGQPWQADEQEDTQTEDHAHHRQSAYVDVDVLHRKEICAA